MVELDEEPLETLLAEYDCEIEIQAGVEGQALVGLVEAKAEGPDVPRIAPGPSLGVPEVRCGHAGVRYSCDRGKVREEKIPTTDGIRFVGVPIVLILNLAASTLIEKKKSQRNVTSRTWFWAAESG